jgi:hypothetical protein
MTDLKEEVVHLLGKFFGDDIIHGIERSYDNDRPEELIELATNMLSGLLGENMAKKNLQPILSKYNVEK